MENDVLYRISEDEAYQYVKQLVPKGSIKLAYCQLFFDLYISKKTILNCMPLLTKDGKIVIECDFYNISKILIWLSENDFYYKICTVSKGICNNNKAWAYGHSVFVIVGKSVESVHSPGSIITFDRPGDYSVIIDALSEFRDTILCIGGKVIGCAIYCKKMCRHVICLSKAPNANNLLREAVKEVDV
jgi:hypothetical protein